MINCFVPINRKNSFKHHPVNNSSATVSHCLRSEKICLAEWITLPRSAPSDALTHFNFSLFFPGQFLPSFLFSSLLPSSLPRHFRWIPLLQGDCHPSRDLPTRRPPHNQRPPNVPFPSIRRLTWKMNFPNCIGLPFSLPHCRLPSSTSLNPNLHDPDLSMFYNQLGPPFYNYKRNSPPPSYPASTPSESIVR